MRVLVCGGRDFTDTEFIYRTLDRLHRRFGFSAVIEGHAHGVDRIAGYWARRSKITNLKFPVSPDEWRAYGKAAGIRRNIKMLNESRPELVIAFPGGDGTNDMVTRARRAHVEVLEITYAEHKQRATRNEPRDLFGP